MELNAKCWVGMAAVSWKGVPEQPGCSGRILFPGGINNGGKYCRVLGISASKLPTCCKRSVPVTCNLDLVPVHGVGYSIPVITQPSTCTHGRRAVELPIIIIITIIFSCPGYTCSLPAQCQELIFAVTADWVFAGIWLGCNCPEGSTKPTWHQQARMLSMAS